MRTTSDNITSLAENEVFVFGSNLSGSHGAGAAKTALQWGAEHGKGIGLTGQTYALPTKDENIQTLSLHCIQGHVNAFIAFASSTPDKVFLVTEIGCGLAGYSPSDISPLFEEAKAVFNIHLPKSFWAVLNATETIKGYKGFGSDMKCLDLQYVPGNFYEIEKDKTLALCPCLPTEAGLHFCEYPLDVLSHYPPYTFEGGISKYAEVVGYGQSVRREDKVAVSKLFISATITLSGLLSASVKLILSKVNFKNALVSNTGNQSAATNTGHQSAATNTGHRSAATNTGHQSAATNTGNHSAATNTGDRSVATNTGDQSAATNTGHRSAATNTGHRSAATNTGHRSAATNTGHRSAATNTGYRSAATNTGYRSAATNTGNQSAATNTGNQSAATNTGDRSAATNTGNRSVATNTGDQSVAMVEGEQSVATSLGIQGKAKGALGCWLILSEWKSINKTWHRTDVQVFKVDGETIMIDTFYVLKNGKPELAG